MDSNQGSVHAHQVLHTSNSHSGLSTVVSVSQQQSTAVNTILASGATGGTDGGTNGGVGTNNINASAMSKQHASTDVNCAQCGYLYSDAHHSDNCHNCKAGAGSSSTGSNSKVNSTVTGANSSHTNVVFEVHDWWSDQVTVQQSSEDEDDDDDDDDE